MDALLPAESPSLQHECPPSGVRERWRGDACGCPERTWLTPISGFSKRRFEETKSDCRSRPVIYEGVMYGSITAVSKKTGLTRYVIRRRVGLESPSVKKL